MRKGKNLLQLAQELQRIEKGKEDFLVPVKLLEMNDGGALTFTNGKRRSLELNAWSAGQVAGLADVPKAYFDRLREENPKLLAKNVNHGLQREPERRFLIRGLD